MIACSLPAASRLRPILPQVKNEDADFGWGVVVNFNKKTNVKVSVVSACNATWSHLRCV